MGRLHIAVAMAAWAGTFGVAPACADVYVWVDATGRMNVSNLSPPEDAQVTSVIKSLPRTAAQEEAARDAARRAEMQVLSERVTRLQDELEQSRREAAWMPAAYAPPPVVYGPPPPYSSWAPPAVSYVAEAPTPPPAFGCDYPWNNCGSGWGAWPYAPTVVVVGGKGAHHRGGPNHGIRPVTPRPWSGPIRPLGVSRRG